ncbi:hypothetical protein KIW84_020200 [Lathyrus oleraceus]|uniref:Uncharacterized protein n=1 Tax=Pisum sativum TaxID=3888 RepID=A0A9D4Y6J3_PEA|nr:hypothetical protein KIW84_020200 [Pisum sativum]
MLNSSKSTFFAGAISNVRLHQIATFLGFKVGIFPFNYLGSCIFKGRPKRIHLQLIANKMKSQLATWKASLLSGRVQLVRSIVQKAFIFPPKSPSISEVIWPPPNVGWVKCNTDGTATPTASSSGGVFHNNLGNFVACFAQNLGVVSSLTAEINGVLNTIETAALNNWKNL